MSDERLADRLPDELPDNPMHWAEAWLDKATADEVQRNPNSVTLVTVSADGKPSARVVLSKSFVADPGYVVLFTNYQSAKCADIANDANVALVFHWDALGRQIRIEGTAVMSPAAESDEYFATRDRGSQLGAWGSDQSRPIGTRAEFLEQIAERARQLGADDDKPIPRPPHWGGIRVWASSIELWIEGKDRIHERARWTRELTPRGDDLFDATPWVGTRLQP